MIHGAPHVPSTLPNVLTSACLRFCREVTVAKVDKDSKVFRDQKGRKYKMATPKVLQARKDKPTN